MKFVGEPLKKTGKLLVEKDENAFSFEEDRY
jgi:hypothetical protein